MCHCILKQGRACEKINERTLFAPTMDLPTPPSRTQLLGYWFCHYEITQSGPRDGSFCFKKLKIYPKFWSFELISCRHDMGNKSRHVSTHGEISQTQLLCYNLFFFYFCFDQSINQRSRMDGIGRGIGQLWQNAGSLTRVNTDWNSYRTTNTNTNTNIARIVNDVQRHS